MDDQRVFVEGSENRLRGRALFFDGSVLGNVLSIDPLDEEIESQGDHHQKHQRLDAVR